MVTLENFRKITLKFGILSNVNVVWGSFSCAIVKSLAWICRKNNNRLCSEVWASIFLVEKKSLSILIFLKRGCVPTPSLRASQKREASWEIIDKDLKPAYIYVPRSSERTALFNVCLLHVFIGKKKYKWTRTIFWGKSTIQTQFWILKLTLLKPAWTKFSVTNRQYRQKMCYR